MESLLSKQILPGKGIENIMLDSHINEIYEIVKMMDFKTIKVAAFYPDLYVYTVLDSLSIYINIFTGLVVRIDLFHNYNGKTPNNIGIGSLVNSLINNYDDILFDESYILIGKGHKMIIETDSDDDIVDLESIKNNTIERITIEKSSWR